MCEFECRSQAIERAIELSRRSPVFAYWVYAKATTYMVVEGEWNPSGRNVIFRIRNGEEF